MQKAQNQTHPDKDFDCCQPLFDDVQSPQITPKNNKKDANIITNHLKKAIKANIEIQKQFIQNIKSQDNIEKKIETTKKMNEESQLSLAQSTLYKETISKNEKAYIPPPNNSKNLSVEEKSVLNQLKETGKAPCNFKFNNLKSEFRKYTEVEIPSLIQQVEDSMYLTEGVIIALKYNFYQKGVKTTILEQVEDNPSLGTSTYQIEGKANEMSHFNVGVNNTVINYKNSKKLYHEYQEKNGVGKLMEAQNSENVKSKTQGSYATDDKKQKTLAEMENDYALVEGSFVIWKADKNSKLFPDNEQSFSMQLPYQSTKEGRMQMSITRDQKVVSLLYFHPNLHEFSSKCNMIYDIYKQHFKILSWELDHDYNFQKPQEYQILCQSIDEFYQKKKGKGFQVHSSRFFSGCKYFMLKFSEKYNNKQKKTTQNVVKYVILDSISGDIIIEIEQNKTQQAYNHREKIIDVHTIDVIIKDLPISTNQQKSKIKLEQKEQYSNEIAIFYGGEIMKFHPIKRETEKNSYLLGFTYISISIEELIQIKGSDRLEYINKKLRGHCHTLKKEDDNVFCLQTPLSNNDEWYKDVCIRPNKYFNFIYLSIIPKFEHQHKKLLIYSTDAKRILKQKYENGTQKRDEKHMALEEKILNKDQIFHHCRNAHIKEDCMFILESQIDGFLGYIVCILPNGEVQTGSIKIDTSETNISKLDITGYPQVVDTNTFERDQKNTHGNRIMQIVSINTEDQNLCLTTKIPLTLVSRKGEEFCYIHKSSLNYLQLSASFPIICRNIGLHQLQIVNIMERNNPKEYVLQLNEDEFFLTFVTFNSYNDIGFYPQFINIECCTNFLFLTTVNKKVKMNLLLVDPYYDEIQIALFKSSHIIPLSDFDEEDIIIKSIICPTRKHHQDQKFQIYVITQYEATINRSMFIEDIEALDGTNKNCLQNDNLSNFFDGESDNDAKRSLENVQMLLDKKNFIYYMTKTQGVCTIFEIDPQDSQLSYHMKIAEVKAENCLAFSISGQKFYVMDELNTIHVLSRMNNSRELKFNYELNIKENSRPEIVYKDFKMNIMNDNYYIQGSQIFYLYKDDPYDDGIMEVENLCENDEEVVCETKQTQNGPILFKGADLFVCTHRIGQFKNVLSVYMLPDSQQVTIIDDFQNSVDLSTFVDNGNILLKCKNRFMIFNTMGTFQSEVQFDQPTGLNKAENDTLNQWKIKNRMKNVLLNQIKKFNPKENKYFVMGSELIDGKSKMELVQISYSNQLFLFYNRILKELNVYQMQDTSDYKFPVKTQFMRTALFKLKEAIQQKFKFKHQYKLEFEKSQIYQNVLDEEISKDEPISQPLNELIRVNLLNNGSVIMSYVINDAHNASDGKEMFKMIVDIFNSDQNQQHIGFVKNFEIDTYLSDLVKKKFQFQIENLIDKQALIQQRQLKLPHAQQDFTEIERIQNQIILYKNKMKSIISQKVYDNIMIAWCGSCLLYSFYSYDDPNNLKIDDFKQIDITFSDLTEIVRVLDTAYPNIYQIIAKDHEINLFIVITWDFKKNMEVHQNQTKMTHANKEFAIRVFKGMNHKMNYFMDDIVVNDLSSNTPHVYIPTQKDDDEIKINQNNNGLNYFDNQKKIFKNNQIFLDTEQPSFINIGVNKMDLIFWENIESKRPSPLLFERNVSLHKFSKFYGGLSLFHYFARDSDLIKVIRDKYLMTKNHQKLDPYVENLPLNAMCPDKDMHSALYHCIEMENLRSFEYIIDLISDFPGICLTNQMIRFIPLMLNKPDSQSFMNFFSKISFKSLSMENKLLINWNQDQDEEFVFLSNTSIITKQLIQQEMAKRGMIDDIKKTEKANQSQESDRYIKKTSQFDLLKKVYKICNEASKNEEKKMELTQDLLQISEQFEAQENELDKLRNQIKSTVLTPDNIDFYTLNQNTIVQNDSAANEIEEGESRVSIEALEFDWVFQGDNAKSLINVLSNLKNFQVLTTKPIKLFVDYIWSQYQSEIIKWIFIPYCIYLITFIYLTSTVLSNIIERNHGDDEIPESEHELCYVAAPLTAISSIFFMFFAQQELTAILDSSVQDYYSDFWNWIDSTTLALNFVFLMIITYCQISEDIFINEFAIRRLGAFACFFMCIKVFYWMRLFESLAKYVSLITNTIIDCLWFMSLVLVIILSFAVFFFVINLNIEDQTHGQDTYIPGYTQDNELLDAFLAMYFICIGMFDVSMYGKGSDEYYIWAMFLLGTFINLIVFMNMLIAIMSKTFDDVMKKEQESSLSEKIFIIKDHMWLIKYNKLFENKKYLIRVSQITSEYNESYGISDYLNTLQTNFNRKFDQLHNSMNQKVLVQDNTSRSFYKIQQESKNGIKQILTYVKSQQNLQKNKGDDQFDFESQTSYHQWGSVKRKVLEKERQDKNIISIDKLLNNDKYEKKISGQRERAKTLVQKERRIVQNENSFSRDSEDEELININKQDLYNKEIKENPKRPSIVRSLTKQNKKELQKNNNLLSQSIESNKSQEEKDSLISSQEMIKQEQLEMKIRSKSQENPNTSISASKLKNQSSKRIKKVIKYNNILEDIIEAQNSKNQQTKTDQKLQQIQGMLKDIKIKKNTNIQESKSKRIQDAGKRYDMFKDLSKRILPQNDRNKKGQGQLKPSSSQLQLDTKKSEPQLEINIRKEIQNDKKFDTMNPQYQSVDMIVNLEKQFLSPPPAMKRESESMDLDKIQLSNGYDPPRQIQDRQSRSNSDSQRKKSSQKETDENDLQVTPQVKSSKYDRLYKGTLYDQNRSQSLLNSVGPSRKKNSLMSQINKDLFNDFNKVSAKGQYTYSTKGQIENKKTKK